MCFCLSWQYVWYLFIFACRFHNIFYVSLIDGAAYCDCGCWFLFRVTSSAALLYLFVSNITRFDLFSSLSSLISLNIYAIFHIQKIYVLLCSISNCFRFSVVVDFFSVYIISSLFSSLSFSILNMYFSSILDSSFFLAYQCGKSKRILCPLSVCTDDEVDDATDEALLFNARTYFVVFCIIAGFDGAGAFYFLFFSLTLHTQPKNLSYFILLLLFLVYFSFSVDFSDFLRFVFSLYVFNVLLTFCYWNV